MHMRFYLAASSTGKVILASLFAAALSSCSTTSTLVVPTNSQAPALKPGTTIIVLDPLVTFESTKTENRLGGEQFGAETLRADLANEACASFRDQGYAVLPARDYTRQNPSVATLGPALSQNSLEFFRGTIPVEAVEELRSFAGLRPGAVVCVHYCRVKIGPGASWDPNSGAITSAMNGSQFKVLLLDAQTGNPLWKNEVYLRQIPNLKNKKCRQAIQQLYLHSPSDK